MFEATVVAVVASQLVSGCWLVVPPSASTGQTTPRALPRSASAVRSRRTPAQCGEPAPYAPDGSGRARGVRRRGRGPAATGRTRVDRSGRPPGRRRGRGGRRPHHRPGRRGRGGAGSGHAGGRARGTDRDARVHRRARASRDRGPRPAAAATSPGVPIDEQAYVQALAAHAAARPDSEWVQAGGWSMSAFPGGTPTRQSLDAVLPDRPAYVPNRDRHGAWVNSRALELAGIDRTTPDPRGGRIEREPDGTPTGALHEAAMDLVATIVPRPGADERMRALLLAQEQLHGLGIVAWQDAIVGNYAGSGDVYSTYLSAARDDLLTARVTGALWWDRDRGLEQVEDLLAQRAEATVGRFRPLAVKIMQDGVVESFTAGMLEPYLDGHGRPTGNSGLSYVEPGTAGRGRPHPRRARLPGARARDRRSGGAGGAGRLRGCAARQRRQRRTSPPGPSAGRPPRRPAQVRAAGRDREHAAAVGLPRAADGRAHAAVPGGAEERLAVPVRRPPPGRRPPGRRVRLAGQQRRPAGRHPGRGDPGDDGCRRRVARAVPARPGAGASATPCAPTRPARRT